MFTDVGVVGFPTKAGFLVRWGRVAIWTSSAERAVAGKVLRTCWDSGDKVVSSCVEEEGSEAECWELRGRWRSGGKE